MQDNQHPGLFCCSFHEKTGRYRANVKAWRKDASGRGKIRDWVLVSVCALAALACLQILFVHWFGGVLMDLRSQNNIATRNDHSLLDSSTMHAHASDVFKLSVLPWRPEAFYEGLPVSDLRPLGQFYVRALDLPPIEPVITIVTATRNPREIFFTRTVRFVLQQSLQAFRWIIVNDLSDDAMSVLRLNELRQWAVAQEPRRIIVIDRPAPFPAWRGRGNGPAAMNYGLRFVDSPFVAILDDDDMWELTALEKAALVMSWVPQASAVSFDVVNHGAKQFLWKRGFYNGDESFFTENNLMQGSPFRSSVLNKCHFREDMADGGADWDFWMCMASHGMWGLHVPEQGNWYQWNPPEFRKKRWRAVTTHTGLKDLRQRIQWRYSNLLKQDAWPSMVLPPRQDGDAGGSANSRDDNYHPYQAPFANRVGSRGQRAVLLVLRDLKSGVKGGVGGAGNISSTNHDSDTTQYAKAFAEAGWRVTVLMTHYTDDANDPNRRQALMRYTHDVFVGANIAPLHKLPDMVAYLVETRGVHAVVADPSPSQISRQLASAAIDMLDRDVVIVDVAESVSATFDVVQETTAVLSASRPGSIKQAGQARQKTTPTWSAFVWSSGLLQSGTQGTEPDNLDRRRIDMRRVQVALQYRKKRDGFGRKLQISCPERVYANTRWIDALEDPNACDGGTDLLKVASLQKSALKQCGAWCLANLGDRGVLGWEFTGSCFRPIESPTDSTKCYPEISRQLQA